MVQGAVAGAAVIDFESLQVVVDNDVNIGSSYSEHRFTLTATHPSSPGAHLNVPGTLDKNYLGSTSMWHGFSHGVITLTRNDNLSFNLISIDLAELTNFTTEGKPIDSGPFELTFYGTQTDGSVVTKVFMVDSFTVFDTYTFSQFTSLTSVVWNQSVVAPIFSHHQFDNINVAVPKPRRGKWR